MSKTSNRPLTKAQIEYAANRIEKIKKEKINAFKDAQPALPFCPEVQNYTEKQRLQFIAAGRAKLKDPDRDFYGYITCAFTYPDRKLNAEDQKLKNAYDKAKKANDAACEKFMTALDKKVTDLLDRLHLGDSASTLVMIEAFAASK
jgi:hypothetical protein